MRTVDSTARAAFRWLLSNHGSSCFVVVFSARSWTRLGSQKSNSPVNGSLISFGAIEPKQRDHRCGLSFFSVAPCLVWLLLPSFFSAVGWSWSPKYIIMVAEVKHFCSPAINQPVSNIEHLVTMTQWASFVHFRDHPAVLWWPCGCMCFGACEHQKAVQLQSL